MWTLARYRLHSRKDVDVERFQTWIWQLGARGTEVRDSQTFAELEGSAFERQDGNITEVIGYFPPEKDPRTATLPPDFEDLLVQVAFEPLDPDGWADGWRQHFAATQVSPRVQVYPSWDPPPDHAKGVAVELDPGMAFGTGTHETTRLCIQIIDRVLAQSPSAAVLDVGCGSGILSICASKLGAPSVRGIDIDPIAVEVARENWQKNDLGDASAAPFSTVPLRTLAPTYGLVLANMLSSILCSLRPELWRILAPGGTLIVSGILAAEEEDFLDAFLSDGQHVIRRHQDGEWIALELAHR